ncbi:hypothetical protein G9A89_017395 [Geosiphon pyriformis]|nr:hypothetical protein G9A89_017395 [Geosiphon pyriformis]
MVFALITKLEKFTSKENNTQAWINNIAKAITANNWDDARTIQVISYFLKNTVNSCSTNQPLESHQQSSETGYNQNPSSQNYLSLLVTPEDTASSKQKTNQKPLTHNIPPAASTEDESLAAIFPFELEEIT